MVNSDVDLNEYNNIASIEEIHHIKDIIVKITSQNEWKKFVRTELNL